MTTVELFKVWHAMSMDVHESQQDWFKKNFNPEEAAALEQESSFTVMADGRAVACGGVLPIWNDRAMVWAIMAQDAGKYMGAITRAAKSILEAAPYNRIEADTLCEFKEGHRWLRMLGFTLEAERLRAYRGDGVDCALYARVRS